MLDRSPNLALLAENARERLGDHEALVYDGRVHRSGPLFERATRVGTGLTGLGVAPGDRVVVLTANCPEVTLTYNAIWRAGGVVTPVMFLVGPDELAHILVDSGARVLITSPELLPTVAGAAPRAPELRHVVVIGAPDGPDAPDAPDGPDTPDTPDAPDSGTPSLPPHLHVCSFADVEAAAAGHPVARAADDLAALLYTGGTTGRAKGVMLSHGNLHACSLSTHTAAQETVEPEGPGRTLIPLPLSHAYGLIVTLVGWHALEPQLAVLQRWFDPAEWLDLAQRHRVHRTTLVPSMIQMLLAQPLDEADLSELRHVASGAAPLPYEVRAEWERRVPGSRILEGYGCTESGSVIATTRPGRVRPGSVGQPLPGYDIEIRDEQGRAVPAGGDGEICVRSAGVTVGYWQAPELTGQTVRDAWLHTGDIGRFDEDGFLYVVDRKKDLILRGGFNVYPRDVEDVLVTHPEVAAAGVVGRPDARLGEEVVAYVTLRGDRAVPAEELVAYAREHLAAHKYPREVRVVGQLPLTSVGKLDRKALRRLYVSGQ
ncbi:class I adenylate-forming enzyme family protein [Streptomyces luteolus]|uniref:AMP-binding protein n=1 Tax=Streptomyces luteolus TaxID=3043615 RepID=A0ABT6T0U5_9ACTN|nr:AMP-binding protein [Streptomyces sp. B-S-A12]MDI3421474.1 AMP-binding protein [Streptomyces sp. B-S-A12]